MSEEKDKSSKLLKFLKLDQFIEHLMGYVDTKIELTRLDIEERLQELIASAIQYLLLFAFLMATVIFFSFALGYYLSEALESQFFGFSIVAIVYLLISLVFVLDGKRSIGFRITEKIFRSAKNEEESNYGDEHKSEKE